MSMTRQIDVTAIIPVYGREDIFRTLKALEEFSYEGVVLWAIVVDNGNTDELSTRLKGLPDHYPWCSVIRLTENRGGAGAFRAGMEEAVRRNGDFVWLLDDDAQVNAQTLPGLLAEYRRLEDEGIRVGAVGGATLGLRDPNRAMEIGANISPFSGALRPRYRDVDIRSIRARTEEVDYVAAASLLVRTQVVREVGPFADVFLHYDDIEWCFRARRMGYRVFTTTRSVVNHAEWEGYFAPWVLYYDARNLLWFLRQYRPLTCVIARMKLNLQSLFLRMNGALPAADLIALGVRHAKTGELLMRSALPEVISKKLPLENFLIPNGNVIILAHSDYTASVLKRLAIERNVRSYTIVFGGLGGRGLLGLVMTLLRTAWYHLLALRVLSVHPRTVLLFDVACTKGYPFPFWCRRRVLFQANGESPLAFVYHSNDQVKKECV